MGRPKYAVENLKPMQADAGRPLSQDDKETLRWCEYHLQRALAARYPMEIEWGLNILYRLGYQHVVWHDGWQAFTQTQSPPYRTRCVDNQMKPLMAERVARFIRQRGEPSVLPATAQPEDRARAKSESTYARYLFRASGGDEVIAEIMGDVVDCGVGFAKVFWDRSAGPKELAPERDKYTGRVKVAPGTECAMCGGTGSVPAPAQQPTNVIPMPGMRPGPQAMPPSMGMPMGPGMGGMPAPSPMMQGGGPMMGMGGGAGMTMKECSLCNGVGGEPMGKVTAQGDARFRCTHPTNIAIHPGATSLYNAEHLFERNVLPTAECRRRWPKKAHLFGDNGKVSSWDYGALRATTAPGGYVVNGTIDQVGMHEIWTMWCAPSDDHPDGYVYRFLRGKAPIEEFDNPDPELGWHPFVSFRDERIPESPWGAAPASNARPIQDEVNRTHGQILESNQNASAPPVVMGANVVVNQRQTAQSYMFDGAIIEVSPYTPQQDQPRYMDYPSLPAQVSQHLEVLLLRMREVMLAGTGADDNESSGRKLAMQDAQVNTLNTQMVIQHQAAMRRVYQRLLWLAKRYTSKQRRLVVLGRKGSAAQVVFDPSTDAFDPADVHVTSGRVFTDNPVANAEIVLEMGLATFMTDEQERPDKQRIFEAIGLGWDDSNDDTALSEEMALEENRQMVETGQPLPISPTDDHAVHGRVVVAEARNYPVGDPRRMALDQHAMMHIQASVQVQMAVQAARGANTRAGAPPSGDIQIPGQAAPVPSDQAAGPAQKVQQADQSLERMATAAAPAA